MKRMKIDALCATGHKWMLSGYGSGFVYISRELMEHSKPHAIGWLSLQDPFTIGTTKRICATMLRRAPNSVVRITPGICARRLGRFDYSIGIENVEARALRA